jgi:hypothetical protein
MPYLAEKCHLKKHLKPWRKTKARRKKRIEETTVCGGKKTRGRESARRKIKICVEKEMRDGKQKHSDKICRSAFYYAFKLTFYTGRGQSAAFFQAAEVCAFKSVYILRGGVIPPAGAVPFNLSAFCATGLLPPECNFSLSLFCA